MSRDDPFGTLILARETLSDQRLEALPKTQRKTLRKALRSIEIVLYARHNATHLAQLDRSFRRIFEATRAAHASHCTCHPMSSRN